jgi:hypothetical protein
VHTLTEVNLRSRGSTEGRDEAAFPMAIPGTVSAVRRSSPAKNISCGKIQIALVSPAMRRKMAVTVHPPRDRSRVASLQVGVSFDIAQ